MVFIDAITLRKMFVAGTRSLEAEQYYINDLNVFPVPDGDTGTNMTLTLKSAEAELSELSEDAELEEVGNRIALGTLKGARGNSGVIMSQLCRGFTKELEGIEKADMGIIARAFNSASDAAYKAVMKPQEGTMLTVAKAVSTRAEEIKDDNKNLEDVLADLIDTADRVLQKTPDMLPVLKEAGVVDSGGQGLVEFMKGAYEALCGKEIRLKYTKKEDSRPRPVVNTNDISTADILYSYCTEFIINLECEFDSLDMEDLKSCLRELGDSLVCVWMDDIVKVHVHTNDPGLAIQKGLEYGSLSKMKIDNMKEEHNERLITEDEKRLNELAEQDVEEEPKEDVINKEYGFISVCTGTGMADVFRNMSVDAIIEGGQTMNPSTEEFLSVIKNINAENIFVLPNNGNVIMAAEQARMLCMDKNILVIPTKTVAQGVTAVINYVPALTAEENAEHMAEAIKAIKTAEITQAVRDSVINGKSINKDDYMALGDDGLITTGTQLAEVAFKAASAMFDDDSEIITIYYGVDVKKEEAEDLGDKLEECFEDADVEIVYGGQPLYPYIISVE